MNDNENGRLLTRRVRDEGKLMVSHDNYLLTFRRISGMMSLAVLCAVEENGDGE
jgi:hypothetical protein